MKLDENKKELTKSFRTQQIMLIGACMINTVVSMLIPYLMGKLIDGLSNPELSLIKLSTAIVALTFIGFLLNWNQNYKWFRLMYRGDVSMRSMMFEGVVKNPYSFFCKNQSGDITNRILNDAAQYADNCLIRLPMLLINVISLVVAFFFIFNYSLLIGVLLLVACITYFFSYKRINIKLRKYSREERAGYSDLLQTTTRFYEGIPTIKLFMREKYFSKKYKEQAEVLGERTIKLQLWKSLALSLSGLIINLMPIIAIVAGIMLTISGKCTVGAIFGIYAYTAYLSEPIQNLTDLNLSMQQAKVNEDRLEELLVEEEEDSNFDEKIEEIKLQDIVVAYKEDEKIFDGFNMDISKGDRIGIVGDSGCGKTTLSHVLTGELKPSSGDIMVNGRTMSLSACKKRIAVLPQDIFLYDDSVLNNIRFGRSQNLSEDMLDTLNINNFKEHKVGELSGGERRRVGLARALMGDFDMLILDEPTAEIDAVMEERIIRFLDEILDKDKMLVVITHRPKILDICNRTVRLEGKIGKDKARELFGKYKNEERL